MAGSCSDVPGSTTVRPMAADAGPGCGLRRPHQLRRRRWQVACSFQEVDHSVGVSCDQEHLQIVVERLTDSSQWQASFSIERALAPGLAADAPVRH